MRLEGQGRDEVSYRKGPRFLTVVADHDRAGAVVWAREGNDAATLEAFYEELGEAGCAQLQAVSMDLGEAFRSATDRKAAGARQCVNPFHVVKLANQAIDTAVAGLGTKRAPKAVSNRPESATDHAGMRHPDRCTRPPAG